MKKNKIKQEFKRAVEKAFNQFCDLSIDRKCKYWKPEAFGYGKMDMEASMDKYFPQEVKEKILKAINDLYT